MSWLTGYANRQLCSNLLENIDPTGSIAVTNSSKIVIGAGTTANEVLRPNAVGDETSIRFQDPNSDYHWDKVDEETPDDLATDVRDSYTGGTGYRRDLYNLPAHSVGSGVINFITIYFRGYTSWEGYAKPSLKSNSTVIDGTEVALSSDGWITYSQQWNTNPATGIAWTWADIDALQIGVSLRTDNGTVWCTQVYVEVNYTEVGSTNFTKWADKDKILLPDNNWWEISWDSVNDNDGHLTLTNAYTGSTLSGQSYKMMRVNYQLKLTVHKGTGASSGSNIYLQNHALSWGADNIPNDLRFTKVDGTTELDYWVETPYADPNTVFIEIPELSSDDTDDVYAYYGKSGDTTTSNIGNTFIFGDDFDRADSGTVGNGWVETGESGGSCEILDHKLVLTRVTTDAMVTQTLSAPTKDIMWEWLSKDSSTSQLYSSGYYNSATNKVWGIGLYTAGKHGWLDSAVWNTTGTAITANQYYRRAIWYKYATGKATLYVDGSAIASDKNPYTGGSTGPTFVLDAGGYAYVHTIDWVFGRKYVSPEPTWGSWGSEETAPPSVELGAFYQQLSPLGFNIYRAGQVRGG